MNRTAPTWNGSTNDDRTNLLSRPSPPPDDNLQMGAGSRNGSRMVNVQDGEELILGVEMTVVRNEFERGENDPAEVLDERVSATAYLWHNYGKSTIGSREDIEQRADRSAAGRVLSRKFYQPDNAVLVLSGKLDPNRRRWRSSPMSPSAKIPRPIRKLDADLHRQNHHRMARRYNVELRRVGTEQGSS